MNVAETLMTTITNEVIYAELLKLDERLQEVDEALTELAAFMKETNRELADGVAKTEALKRSLFGNRFSAEAANNV
jgi:hypothetical protein